jgi:hypothetical protein
MILDPKHDAAIHTAARIVPEPHRHTRMRLFFMRGTTVVDVIDAYPSTFYSYLPDWMAVYADCSIRARVFNPEEPHTTY